MLEATGQSATNGSTNNESGGEQSRSPWKAQDRRDLIPVLGFREYWWPALPANLVRKRPKKLTMLGQDLVFFRGKEKGTIVCADPICPHRGGNLLDGDCHWAGTITCPYHAWTYNEDGECVASLSEGPNSLIPDLGVKLRMHPTRVLKGLVFVWMGAGKPPPIEEDVPPEFFLPHAHIKTHIEYWTVNWRKSVENASDAHAQYIHRNSIQGGATSRIFFAGPHGERTRIVNGRSAVLSGYSSPDANPRAAAGVKHHFPKLGHEWPKSRWRRLWIWFFGPVNRWGTRRNARKKNSLQEMLPEHTREEWGGVGFHMPGQSRRFPVPGRRDVNGYGYTRVTVPVSEGLTRQFYYHCTMASSWLGRLYENVYWNTIHAYIHYTNFQKQDLRGMAHQWYNQEEFFSSNDAALVAWRKMAPMSRDAKRAAESRTASPEQTAEAGEGAEVSG